MEAHILGGIHSKAGDPKTPDEVREQLKRMVKLRSDFHAAQIIIKEED